jgi:signal transduction histidine kinase
VSGEQATASAPAELHGFSVDISHLKRAEAEARRATQARDDLLAVVTHDLRSPLSAIKVSAALVGRALAQPEQSPRASNYVSTIDRLLQITANLVGNAIKFTPRDGEITIRVTRHDGEAEFSIRDNGPGIPSEELTLIWRRFWRAKRDSGIGLGLTIAKGLVEAQGGRIWAESAIGAGTTFHFTLPLARGATGERSAPPIHPGH